MGATLESKVGGTYAKYVLFVLVLVYIANFVDRLIISIVAEEIKADLGISDAQLGFLSGTAFAVFYAVFGLPLGRLADLWVRKSLISIGLVFWSTMTALSGTASNFPQLAVYRFGVGVGEASASPAAFSILSDYFSPKVRATVLAIYSAGAYIGMGLGIFAGGWVVDGWKGAYDVPGTAPFDLAAWQAAFLVVGLPGVLLAVWVFTLAEPRRGQSEGIYTPPHPHPFREAGHELMSILPPFTFYKLYRSEGGTRVLVNNLVFLLLLCAGGTALASLTGNPQQWIVVGAGFYATFSWVQHLAIRDNPTFTMMFRSKAFLYSVVGFPSISFVSYGVVFWTPAFFIRAHGVDASEVGTIAGLSMMVGGGLGVVFGGFWADRWKKTNPRARILIGLVTVALTTPAALLLFTTREVHLAYVANFFFTGFSAMWVGAATSTINDLVMPRMRAVASAFYFLMNTLVGLALGPFMVGQVSDWLMGQGHTGVESLRAGLFSCLLFLLVPTICFIACLKHIQPDENNRLTRALNAGEKGLQLAE